MPPFNEDSLKNSSNAILFWKTASIAWAIVVYLAAFVFINLTGDPLSKHLIYLLVPIIVLQSALIGYFRLFVKRRFWLYLFLQAILISISSMLMLKGAPILLIGLLPIFISQSFTVFKEMLLLFITFVVLYFVFYCFIVAYTFGMQELPIFIAIFCFLLIVMNFFSITYMKQMILNLRMNYYLRELKKENQKIEKLTLLRERQRMARDLHDTLAQGLAGLIMQLEATEAHLQVGNVKRSQEIISQAMMHARETLRNARTVIDDLRAELIEDEDFKQEIVKKINRLADTLSIKAVYQIDPIPQLPIASMEHFYYIIDECFANIAKHSHAKKVEVFITKEEKTIRMTIKDDGIGFNIKKVRNHLGKYGLLGLMERSQLIHAAIKFDSTPGVGTTIRITLPIEKELIL